MYKALTWPHFTDNILHGAGVYNRVLMSLVSTMPNIWEEGRVGGSLFSFMLINLQFSGNIFQGKAVEIVIVVLTYSHQDLANPLPLKMTTVLILLYH